MNELSFDSFMSFPSKERKRMIHDPECLKIMIQKNLKQSRYLHSISVAETAAMLAEYHHMDKDKAYTAGLLHDCTKYFSEAQHDEYLKYYDPQKLAYPESCKHAFSAGYYLKEKLNLHDSDILNAIRNHTICFSRDRLSIILYIADKREPLRGIDDGILELAKKDLYEAFFLLCGAKGHFQFLLLPGTETAYGVGYDVLRDVLRRIEHAVLLAIG